MMLSRLLLPWISWCSSRLRGFGRPGTLGGVAVAVASGLHAANPLLPGADPHAIVLGDTVWLYPTWSDERRGQRFFAFASTNLTTWQRHGPVLDFEDVRWIKDDGQERHHAWAPSVLVKAGRWFFYYSVGPQNPTPSRIGVAVGDGPQGPFRDSGQPLLTGGQGFEAIDPMAYTDPRTGQAYLYAGGSAGAKLRVFELNPDLISVAREIPVETPPQFTEGAFMHDRDGRYYLSYSHGGWQHSSYSVHYATADSPTGPWTYRGAILTSDATRKGPGHHSFLRRPGTDEWLIAYHRWENPTGDGPYRGRRQLCLDPVGYDAQGLIRPIAMSGGTAATAAGTFTNPINPGPDPWMTYHAGHYYLTTTQGDCIRMWKAPTVAGLKAASGVEVWRDHDPRRSHGIWAPEFHFISNRWYLYYTAMAATRVDTTHRMHVLESEGHDPLGPYHYQGRLYDPANDFYAIDGSVFQHPGDSRWYFLWAAHPGHRIRIARLANPWTLEGRSVQLEASGFGCDEVREGPVVLHRNGRLFLTYSACDTGKPDYQLGLLIAEEHADVLDPASWIQHPTPVFARHDDARVFGPGHHGFFRSPDGTEDWIVYHGKTSSNYTYAGRTTRVQKFTWNADGTPNFGRPLSLDTVLPEPSARLDRAQENAGAASAAYASRTVEGWQVRLRRTLLDEPDAAETTARALTLLQRQLAEIVRVVPAPALRELQRVPLYFSPEYPGHKPTAEFHPDAGWLRENGRDVAMAKAIEFTNLRQFEAETERMPNFALHELAHAYHDRVLPEGFANPEIQAAYARAKASGRYDRVERRFGGDRPRTFERAYARENPMEFFAETTEAYFSRNDYFPFSREDLQAHDPETFDLLTRLWGVAGPGPQPPQRGNADPSTRSGPGIPSTASLPCNPRSPCGSCPPSGPSPPHPAPGSRCSPTSAAIPTHPVARPADAVRDRV